MGASDIAKRLLYELGDLLNEWRGPVPASVLCYWTACETGGNRFAVSRDKVLIECGISQAPLARARTLGADPFDLEGGTWLHCYEAAKWHAKWSIEAQGRDVLYLMLVEYSIGPRGVNHIVNLTGHYKSRGDTIEQRALWIARNVDLSLPPSSSYFGRQSGELVAQRLIKQSKRLDAAAAIGPLDGPPGNVAPACPPRGVAGFPSDLIPAAVICASRDASPDDHLHAWEDVRAYAKARRIRERVSKPPLTWRVTTALQLLHDRLTHAA